MPGVYISYPFCAQKCTYCNFASGVFPRELEQRYAAALEREIASQAWPWTPETVYLGGGTPSGMPAELLDRLLARIPGRPWREATLEAAPGALTREAAEAWAAAGITRVSLGVQSFVPREIARTGRKHAPARVAEECAMLRALGMQVNLDLIAGLSGQTRESWAESLGWIERIAPEHVSVYLLEIDEDSRLGLEILENGSRYGARDVPGEDLAAELYETAVARLAALGIPRYEISNFARPGCESLHNLKYWQREPYLGFGGDAHSFDGVRRWANLEDPAAYAGAADPRQPATPAEPLEEKFFLGLRLARGIRPEPPEWLRFERPIDRFLADGLLESEDGWLRLSPRGVLVSNEIFQEFLIS